MKFRVLAFAFLFSATLAAQQPDMVGLADFPVPAWPADGKLAAADLRGKYVYLDLPKNEYVVIYPENLGTDTFAQNPGALKINRYELLRNVAPSVSAIVAAVPNSAKFKYTYSVANASSAKQSIDQFVLVIPEHAAKDAIRHPDGWFGILQKGRTFKLKNPE